MNDPRALRRARARARQRRRERLVLLGSAVVVVALATVLFVALRGGSPASLPGPATSPSAAAAGGRASSPLAGRSGSATPPAQKSASSVPSPTTKPSPTPRPTASAAAVAARPHIVQDLIPFGETRQKETAAYSLRHYGVSTWRLDARVIVLHYTVSSTYPGVHATFAADTANRGELPGVVSQFVIDKDGTIYQQLALDVMGRHVIGLNRYAIGIEFVQEGGSNAEEQIMARGPQIAAGLKLVAWLQATYGISAANVIGHGTANGSPLFKDNEGWRNDHVDWDAAAVARFKAKLTALQ